MAAEMHVTLECIVNGYGEVGFGYPQPEKSDGTDEPWRTRLTIDRDVWVSMGCPGRVAISVFSVHPPTTNDQS